MTRNLHLVLVGNAGWASVDFLTGLSRFAVFLKTGILWLELSDVDGGNCFGEPLGNTVVVGSRVEIEGILVEHFHLILRPTRGRDIFNIVNHLHINVATSIRCDCIMRFVLVRRHRILRLAVICSTLADVRLLILDDLLLADLG